MGRFPAVEFFSTAIQSDASPDHSESFSILETNSVVTSIFRLLLPAIIVLVIIVLVIIVLVIIVLVIAPSRLQIGQENAGSETAAMSVRRSNFYRLKSSTGG